MYLSVTFLTADAKVNFFIVEMNCWFVTFLRLFSFLLLIVLIKSLWLATFVGWVSSDMKTTKMYSWVVFAFANGYILALFNTSSNIFEYNWFLRIAIYKNRFNQLIFISVGNILRSLLIMLVLPLDEMRSKPLSVIRSSIWRIE